MGLDHLDCFWKKLNWDVLQYADGEIKTTMSSSLDRVNKKDKYSLSMQT